ncbi:MAG: helix-turn-helix domain-containing protein [Actinomycetales bacterium]
MSIGQTLREAREAAGMTVEQVSEATRIRGTLIRGIEQDDFSLCGGDVYARGHLRAIARVVGTDPAPLLEEYDRERGGASTADAAPAHVVHDLYDSDTVRAAAAADRRRGPNWTAAIAVVLVLVCVYAGVRLLTGRDSGAAVAEGPSTTSSAPVAPVSPSAPASTPAVTTTTPEPSSSSSIIAERPGAVTVGISATRGTSWIQATDAAGKVLYSGLLRKGSTRDLSADASIKLVMGNAGSLDLVVNGTPIGAPGKPGDVVRVTFTPQDPAAG